MLLASRIRQLREKSELTQQELANLLHVSKASICKYEKDKSYPSLDILLKMADIFNVSTDYLLGREEKPKERWI